MRPQLVAILGALSGVSCADATGSDALTLAAIAGPYQASHYVYQAVGDTTRQVDQVALGVQSTFLQLVDDAYLWVDSFPANPQGVEVRDSGTATLTGDTLRLVSPLTTAAFQADRRGGALVLTDTLSMRLLCPTLCLEPVRRIIVLVRQ